MITPATIVASDENVVFTEMGNGEAVLLHLGTSHYFSLNETGTLIWQTLTGGASVGETAVVLESRYDVTLEQALQSVMVLVGELSGERLLYVDTDGASEATADG